MSDLKISQLTAYTTPLDADLLVVNDTANSTTKKTLWSNIKATLKTYFDTLYSPVFTTSAGLASILSDETGSGGGVVVFSASPTIVTPTIASMTNAQHNHTNAAGGGQITDAALSTQVGIAKGGTGQVTANAALNALLPSQTGNAGKPLKTNGTDASWSSAIVFGGDGTDGALSVSSGNTNIDCAGAALVVKNYTSISITGTGSITFINPHANGTAIVIKSQGNVTLTSSAAPMIDASGMGSAGGAAVASTTGLSTAGNSGSAPTQLFLFRAGAGGGGPTSTSVGAGGATGATPTWASVTKQFELLYPNAFIGAGGGSGASSNGSGSGTATSGAGGNGGGCLIVECAGALNFTTASGISVAGKNGGNGSIGGIGASADAQGGGGGGGGYCALFYNTLTSASGTINSGFGSGGTGAGTGGAPAGAFSNAAGGGGGGSVTGAGTSSAAGTTTAVSGGAGATGYSIIDKNIYLA